MSFGNHLHTCSVGQRKSTVFVFRRNGGQQPTDVGPQSRIHFGQQLALSGSARKWWPLPVRHPRKSAEQAGLSERGTAVGWFERWTGNNHDDRLWRSGVAGGYQRQIVVQYSQPDDNVPTARPDFEDCCRTRTLPSADVKRWRVQFWWRIVSTNMN